MQCLSVGAHKLTQTHAHTHGCALESMPLRNTSACVPTIMSGAAPSGEKRTTSTACVPREERIAQPNSTALDTHSTQHTQTHKQAGRRAWLLLRGSTDKHAVHDEQRTPCNVACCNGASCCTTVSATCRRSPDNHHSTARSSHACDARIIPTGRWRLHTHTMYSKATLPRGAHAHAHAHTHTQRTHTHAHTRTHTHTRTRTHAHTHTHAHTRMRTHARACTHTAGSPAEQAQLRRRAARGRSSSRPAPASAKPCAPPRAPCAPEGKRETEKISRRRRSRRPACRSGTELLCAGCLMSAAL
jgi:hypothetical protein